MQKLSLFSFIAITLLSASLSYAAAESDSKNDQKGAIPQNAIIEGQLERDHVFKLIDRLQNNNGIWQEFIEKEGRDRKRYEAVYRRGGRKPVLYYKCKTDAGIVYFVPTK